MSQTPDPALTPLAEALAARARDTGRRPLLVALGGGVASGKSALAAVLAEALRGRGLIVEVVAGDGFLLPNAELEARGLMARKGFPESFDDEALRRFHAAVRAGAAELEVPTYSHEAYDVAGARRFPRPDVLILEGVNALAWPFDYGVYLHADEADAEAWYVARFLALGRQHAPRLAARLAAAGGDAEALARAIWAEVNRPNLRRHIAPSCARADAVVEKGPDHAIRAVSFR